MQIFEVYNTDIDMRKRLDFNFWSPRKSLNSSQTIVTKSLKQWVGDKALTTSAFYPSITPFYETIDSERDSLPFIRVSDARKLILEFNDTVFLNKDLLDSLSGNIKRVSPGDVVITKGGEYIGEAALVPDYYEEYAICRDILAIKVKDSSLTGEYITSYFQSNWGKTDLIRTRSVQGQPHLTLDKLYDLEIPYLGDNFEKEIQQYWNSFYKLVAESNNHLIKAKEILNSFLHHKLTPQNSLDTFERVLDKVSITKRVDFDYYNNRWTKLVDELKVLGIEFEQVNYIKESYDFSNPQEVFKYITLTDIDDRSGIIKNYNNIPAHSLPDRAKRAVEHNDVLVSSLKGSKRKVALVEDDFDNMLASTGFYVIRSDKLKPEVIYAIFRSNFYELFIEQMATGSIMTSIIEKYFKILELPIIDEPTQLEIVDEIKNYLTKRAYAFENLEDAAIKFDTEFQLMS